MSLTDSEKAKLDAWITREPDTTEQDIIDGLVDDIYEVVCDWRADEVQELLDMLPSIRSDIKQEFNR